MISLPGNTPQVTAFCDSLSETLVEKSPYITVNMALFFISVFETLTLKLVA